MNWAIVPVSRLSHEPEHPQQLHVIHAHLSVSCLLLYVVERFGCTHKGNNRSLLFVGGSAAPSRLSGSLGLWRIVTPLALSLVSFTLPRT